MIYNKCFVRLTGYLRAAVFVLAGIAWPLSHAATIWTGPNLNYVKSTSTPADTIIACKVALKRNSNQWLYNSAAGETAASATSPKDTMWAFGNIANATTLSYKTMDALHSGGTLASRILNQPMVVHLINEDIYFAIKFTTWGQHFAGTVAYTRSTPAVAVAPTVSITSPVAGAIFTAPASISLTANASVSGGTVSDVEYFAGSTSLGHASVAPFNLTANISAPGSYALTAKATANGVSTTSAAVNITVVSAPTVTITSPTDGATFDAPANVKITVNASASGGTVTNVSFFNQTTLLGSVQSSPFDFTASNLAAGSYALSAVATASGISATSGVVNITVSSAAAPTISAPNVSSGLFSFSYTADPGQSYVVERASTLNSSSFFDWAPVATNVASSGLVGFSEALATNLSHFYRVGRLPNP